MSPVTTIGEEDHEIAGRISVPQVQDPDLSVAPVKYERVVHGHRGWRDLDRRELPRPFAHVRSPELP